MGACARAPALAASTKTKVKIIRLARGNIAHSSERKFSGHGRENHRTMHGVDASPHMRPGVPRTKLDLNIPKLRGSIQAAG
jgi:hypothetical protein